MQRMAKNVGGVDRVIRAVVGAGLLASLMLNNSFIETYGMPWIMIAGMVLLLTSIFKFCPAYMAFGMNTCKTK
jgi:hypothetical protein